MGAQKTFFCVKFPKTKLNSIFFSPKRLFPVFRLSTREMSFCNLALFENAQNLRDKFLGEKSKKLKKSFGRKENRFRTCFWKLCTKKTFFCVKFPKTKPNAISNLPKRLFQVFRFSTLEMSLSNLALFENAQNVRDKI